jgi:hypothetical protein
MQQYVQVISTSEEMIQLQEAEVVHYWTIPTKPLTLFFWII